ncbi:unnamed protein product [Nippostrongylus brasiliensis]|uniref:Uncharacterized protein n=1 Tax=Nippostrongylus brasiliensis TaxID=27835 RepID=A0A0N4XT58_NIPBR|nr:unnamed protein product [Nippostrongylus brasiliensis]
MRWFECSPSFSLRGLFIAANRRNLARCHPIYTSGSELVIECSSSECLEDPNQFLTAQKESMALLEKEAIKCLDELVKDGRLKKAVEKFSKNRKMEVEVLSDSSIEEQEYNADESTQNPSENVRQPRQAGSSSPGRGKKDKGPRQTTEPTISSSKRPRKRRPWHEKLFQNTKACVFDI